jgi:hypothetical protein
MNTAEYSCPLAPCRSHRIGTSCFPLEPPEGVGCVRVGGRGTSLQPLTPNPSPIPPLFHPFVTEQIAFLAIFVQRTHRRLLSAGYLSFNRSTSVLRHVPLLLASLGTMEAAEHLHAADICTHGVWCGTLLRLPLHGPVEWCPRGVISLR